MAVRIPSWTDNTGAESVSNKLFTSSYPLGVFAQRLALFSCFSGLELVGCPDGMVVMLCPLGFWNNSAFVWI